MRGRFFPILMLCAALSACATTAAGIGDKERLVALPMSELPLPPSIDPENNVRPYFLGPKDRLSINVYGDETLSMPMVQVSGGGRIDMPLLGEIAAQGHTTTELARTIEARLVPILKDPQVSVNILDPVSQQITIDGAIGKPGLYPVVGRMTLQQAIVAAGSTSEISVLDKVVVMRRIEGKSLIALSNL